MFEHFPTEFAFRMAHTTEILPACSLHKLRELASHNSKYTVKQKDAMMKSYTAVQEFQTLAVLNDFESSLIAFHGIELNDEQRLALELIHKNMPSYTKGFITAKLLERINSSNDKELVNVAALLMEILNEADPESKGDKILSARKLIVNLSSGK